MKKKVLLIVPNHYYYAEYHWIPGNMIFLATTLYARGYSPVIVDDRVLKREETLEQISSNIQDSIIVLISTSSGRQLYNALQIASFIKTKYDTPIVFGGSHPSAAPEITMTDKNIDYVVMGQGEYIICDLCDLIINNNIKGIDDIPNIFYRKDKIVKTNAKFERININNMPKLVYFNKEIIDIRDYLNPETMAINYSTSTGCIGKCSFCFWYKDYKYSFFDNERVIRDLKKFKELYNIRNINFDDPTFFVGRKRTLELARLIIREELDVKWRANGRVDFLKGYTEDDWRIFKQSGCQVIHIGLESGSEKIIKLMNKEINPDDTIKLIKVSKSIGMKLRFHIILGNPTETIEDLKLTADLLDRLIAFEPDIDYTINFFTPFPGNEMTEIAKEHGYIPSDTLKGYTQLHVLNFKHLPKDDRSIAKETSPWKEDFDIPWFTESFRKEYMKIFRELIPEKSKIQSTDAKLERIFE